MEGPAMIIAGAGSGKTRVITCRAAHLIQQGVDPFQILILTFTNKAAKEMCQRITEAAGAEAKNVWMGTFHAIFAKILRIEADKLAYPRNFTIYDSDDSRSLLRTILNEMKLDDKLYNLSFVASRISSAKNQLISAGDYGKDSAIQSQDLSSGRKYLGAIYETYVRRCYKAGAMDFDDLLFNTQLLLEKFPEVCYKYQHKFKYLMVDEYQDTNFAQYTILKKLAAVHENICVVGDDSQSIYAFRGASIHNILSFEKDYPNLNVFKLEENYRSTQNIVDAANSVIVRNVKRLKKSIYSTNEAGDKVRIIRASSDNEEGRLVAEAIVESKRLSNLSYKDFAILYRTNAQSRAMEEALRRLDVPYKVYGGLSFYQRKEIKDVIAYFRLSLNPNDEEAIKRAINYPRRGIGDTTIAKLLVAADQHQLPLGKVISQAQHFLDQRGASAVFNFAVLIQSFQVIAKEHSAYDAAKEIAERSGILKALGEDKSIEGISRHENVQALLDGIKEFSERADIEHKTLDRFMEEVALLTHDDQEKDHEMETVSLMTVHAAKGLEFREVFVVGLEENLFPSHRSLASRTDLEEERRLFYVAITRAKKRLSLCYSISRYYWGKLSRCDVSRFIDEIDSKYLELEFPEQKFKKVLNEQRSMWASGGSNSFSESLTLKSTAFSSDDLEVQEKHFDTLELLQIGMEVEHERFGYGKVIGIEGAQANLKATIFFKNVGQKQLLLKFAKLRILS